MYKETDEIAITKGSDYDTGSMTCRLDYRLLDLGRSTKKKPPEVILWFIYIYGA